MRKSISQNSKSAGVCLVDHCQVQALLSALDGWTELETFRQDVIVLWLVMKVKMVLESYYTEGYSFKRSSQFVHLC